MALLAEEIVEEWLNRQGFFTIRGIKLGVHEMDLLALRPSANGVECRHLEVQASVRPISYLTRVPKAVQTATGRAPGSSKTRVEEELRQGVNEWIAKKYDYPEKQRVRSRLAAGPWSRELVVHRVKFPEELAMIEQSGITVHRLADIVADLQARQFLLAGAAGAHLVELITLRAAEILAER